MDIPRLARALLRQVEGTRPRPGDTTLVRCGHCGSLTMKRFCVREYDLSDRPIGWCCHDCI